MSCNPPNFKPETSVKINLPDVDPCCGDSTATPEIPSLVQYNGQYCHPGSANFSATPVEDTPCFIPEGEVGEPPEPPLASPLPAPPYIDIRLPDPLPEDGDGTDDDDIPPPPLITAPEVEAQAATAVTTTAATLNSSVDANSAATTAFFEYGLTTAYGSSTAPSSAGSGADPVTFSQGISGLTPDTIYHYRVRATNVGGTTISADRSFTTDPTVVVTPPTPTNPQAIYLGMSGRYQNNTLGQKPLPDATLVWQTPGFVTALRAGRTTKSKIIVNGMGGQKQNCWVVGDDELSDPANKVGGFALRKAYANLTKCHTALPDPRSYLTDGTFAGFMLFDDFGPSSDVWNDDPPTEDEVDLTARFAKQLSNWSSVPMVVRGPFSPHLSGKTDWLYLDCGWLQYVARYGSAAAWFRSQMALGKRLKLGAILGFNLTNGGGGPTSALGWGIRPSGSSKWYGMSPAEIDDWADAVEPYVDESQGINGWIIQSEHPLMDDSYFRRTDIQAALTRIQNRYQGILRGPLNYR